MKRIGLFLATNIAVLAVIAVLVHLGLGCIADANGINRALLAVSAVIGFSTGDHLHLETDGCKRQTGGANHHQPANADEASAWSIQSPSWPPKPALRRLRSPIYEGAKCNAFATGALSNSALVAVVRLLSTMGPREAVALSLRTSVSCCER